MDAAHRLALRPLLLKKIERSVFIAVWKQSPLDFRDAFTDSALATKTFFFSTKVNNVTSFIG